MAELKFRVQADYEKVQRLRDEITKLKQEIKGVDAIQDPTSFNKLNSKLQQTSKELGNVTGKIAEASAAMETDFKQKIFAASQGVNDFTEKIIAQKGVVRDVAADVKRLGEAYRESVKSSPLTSDGKLAEWKAAKNALDEEKAALFALTQEQATARLSVKKLRDEYALLRQEGGGTAETMNLLTGKLKQMSGMLIGGMGLKELAGKIVSVRAEFESMETSLKVLLGGNEERLSNIMGQIKEYALASPLNTKDMVGAVQMMTSFGIEAEKSIDYLKAIGDISMGDTGKFNSLALAFSQMSSAGKLMGQDLLQMINAGFSPLEEISRKTGKSIGELKNEMSKGAITSKMVQDAFISATSAGGKFYGMSSEGAKTLNGQISMLQESFDNMFNEIGSKGEGVVMSAVKAATYLVENYEQVGRVIVGLATAFGIYRTAVALATMTTNGYTIAETLAYTRMLLLEKATKLLNMTMLANPYVAAAAALGTLVGAIIATSDGLSNMERAQRDVNDAVSAAEKAQEEYNAATEQAISVASDDKSATEDRRKAMNLLISRYPSIIQKYIDEEGHLRNILQMKREIANIDGDRVVSGYQNKSKDADRAARAFKAIQKAKKDALLSGSGEGQYMRFLNKQQQEDATWAIGWYKKARDLKWYQPDGSTQDMLEYAQGQSAAYREKAKQQNATNHIPAFQDAIGKMNNKRLATVSNTLNKLKNSKSNIILPWKELEGASLSPKNIRELITYVNGIKESRKSQPLWVASKNTAKSEVLKARAHLESLKKSGKATVAQVEEAQKKLDKANESYKKLSGNSLDSEEKASAKSAKSAETASKKAQKERETAAKAAEKAAEQQNEANEKAFEIETKAKLENRRKAEDLANETEQAEINILKDGNEKKLRQIELNRKKEQEAIDRAFEDIKQQRIEQAKQKWEANPKNKGKNFYNSSEYSYASSNDRYTDTEYKNYDTKTKAAWHKYDEEIAKLKDAEIAYEDSLIKANESYFDKKTDLVKKYSKEVSDIYKAIAEAEKRGDKEKADALYRTLTEARANYGKEQMTLAFEQLKKDPNYVAAFDDLKGASTDTLNSLIGRFSEVKQAAGEALNPEGVKTYFDAINGMIDELISRDPIGMIKKLTDELIKQQDELKAAESRRDRVKGGEKIVKSIGYNKDLKKWVSEYWELADAEADVAAKGQQVAQTTHKIENAHKTLTKSIQGVADKMGELGGKIGGQTGEIFSLFGSVMTYYQTISDGVTAIGKAGSNAMKAIESASVILAIISAAIQLMQTLSSVLPNQDDLYEKAAQKQAEINKLRDSVNDYRLAVMKARHEESNWFSDSGLKGLQDAYEEHGQVAESYYKKLNEAQEKYIDKSSGLKKALVPIVAGVAAIGAVAAGVLTAGVGTVALGSLGSAIIGALSTSAVTATVATAAGAAVAGLAGAIVGKAIDSAVSSITYKNGQVAAKDNLRIQTQHKSFWRGQKTDDLKEWVKKQYGKDLFGEDGMIDKELANEVLKTYGHKLQGETKETLEKLVELREKYDEFNKSIHEYVSKMYSPLVSDMTDAVWSWLKDGKDALSEFKNSASKTFAEISKDMVKQLLLKNVFSKYEDKLSDLYKKYAMKSINESELGAASANLAGEIVDSMNTYLPVAQSLLKQLQEGFAAKGIDITKEGDSSQTATANGVTSITFEQASNIIALTTAGNISRDQIKDILTAKLSTMDASMRGVQMMAAEQKNIADELRTIQANSYLELQGIHDDTSAMNKTLKMLSSDVSDIKKKIKDNM
ncbi:tape measure protein [Prevotella melaninogenica]|uniref:tape measure protein n=1 Tax=Prevotella melaninogenica TaxID=28132 RepID=UPI001BAD7936|nr:tape measure protein [Prevotella melaninogenica]QUB63723.1 tape measure protein [Prevotella melaninogenica]